MTLFQYKKVVETLKDIVKSWGKANVYLVGGCVRDSILGIAPSDIDLCIDLDNGASLFCDYLKENHSDICSGFTVFPRYGTSKFTLKYSLRKRSNFIEIECSMPRTETYNLGPRKPDQVKYTSLTEDAYRRDFCCNALYQNLVTSELVDPTGRGKEHIRKLILDTPKDPVDSFREDPLRMLRAIRFAYKKLCYTEEGWNKKFSLSDRVKEALKDYPEYYELSMDRVRDEFGKIIISKDSDQAVRDLYRYGLLKYIIPELSESWGFDQRNHHHSMNLTDHLLNVLKISNKGNFLPEAKEILNLAALLHDISKYKKHDINKLGEFSYHEHEIDSAAMASGILKRLRYGNKTIDAVCDLIRNHMILKPFYDYETHTYKASPRSTRKLKDKIDALTNKYRSGAKSPVDIIPIQTMLLILINSDNLSHAPEYCMPNQTEEFVDTISSCTPPKQQKLQISGKDIMEKYGVVGPAVGEIKKVLQEYGTETEEEAYQEFDKEFKDKVFWAWTNYDYSNPPLLYTLSGEEKPSETTRGYFSKFQIQVLDKKYKDSILDKLGDNGLAEIKAQEFPCLFRKLIRHYKSRQIVYEIGELMGKLEELGELKEATLSIDSFEGITGRIEWDDYIDNVY